MCLRREIAVGESYLSAGFEGSLLGLFLKIAVENDGLSSRYRETALLDAKVPGIRKKGGTAIDSSFVLKNTKDFLNLLIFVRMKRVL